MKDQEKEKMLEVLGVADLIASETHRPVELRRMVQSVPNTPNPTVYSWVDRAVGHGLMEKSESESGYKAVSITLKGYRLLGSKPGVSAKPLEAAQGVLTLEQAYRIVSELFIAGEALGASERKALVNSLDKLLDN